MYSILASYVGCVKEPRDLREKVEEKDKQRASGEKPERTRAAVKEHPESRAKSVLERDVPVEQFEFLFFVKHMLFLLEVKSAVEFLVVFQYALQKNLLPAIEASRPFLELFRFGQVEAVNAGSNLENLKAIHNSWIVREHLRKAVNAGSNLENLKAIHN